MKKRSKMEKRLAILAIGLILLGVSLAGWTIGSRYAAQREWPWKQLQNAVTLGAALSTYQQNHGSYPARLEDLVTGGTLNQQELDDLQFRTRPHAAAVHWLYKTPDHPYAIAIVSPAEIFPWHGHSGNSVVARADGNGELISHDKRYHLPAWATK